MSLRQETEMQVVPHSFLSKGAVRLQDVSLQSIVYLPGRRKSASKNWNTMDTVFEKCGNRKS
jgi:molybdopterin biosynthesis enzyme MoaB